MVLCNRAARVRHSSVGSAITRVIRWLGSIYVVDVCICICWVFEPFNYCVSIFDVGGVFRRSTMVGA